MRLQGVEEEQVSMRRLRKGNGWGQSPVRVEVVMSFENALGSVVSRVRAIEATIQAIEDDLAIEKAKLTQALADLKLIQQELRPKE